MLQSQFLNKLFLEIISITLLCHGISSRDYLTMAQGFLPNLLGGYIVNKTGETAHIGVLDRDMALLIAKVDSDNPFRMMSYIGWRAPLHCCALGKVLLAYNKDQSLVESIDLVRYTPNTIVDLSALRIELDRIRTQGWAIDDEEAEQGLRCYAAPIRNFEGEVIATISVSSPKVRSNAHNKDLVLEAARKLSCRMGYPDNQL